MAVLSTVLWIPVRAEDSPKEEGKTDEQLGDAKEAAAAGVAKAQDRSHTFTGMIDVEVGGSPMMNSEMTGTHVKPYTRIAMDMMGRSMEIWSDGTTSVSKNQEGQWQKGGGRGRGGSMKMEDIAKAIKSAKWDGEAKVGSHECRVIRAKADDEAMKKALGGGRMGGAGEMKKSSVKMYVDKKDGRLRRMKLSMTVEANMGGNPMELDISADYRYKFSSSVKLEMPDEVKALFEEKEEAPDEKKPEDPKPEENKDGEGK
ncbi:MAG: hypothetical protein HYY18_00280 [Planctomycetes bacterium]|nr:hypothetical protein [Planctomycetota bacterium]